jgi:hypothetical protein
VNAESISPWGADWVWGLPLIVVTVIFHVIGLNFIKTLADRRIRYLSNHQAFGVGLVTLFLTSLPAIEASVWALTFLFLGAVPDEPTAILYSLNAITAFGHTDINLGRKWQLMGAMESLNGWILFGLSTAYLFVLIQTIWGDSRTTRLSENPE